MPITLPVETSLDPRSVRRTTSEVEKRFGRAGQDAGQAFAKGLDDAAAKADPKTVERWTKAYDKVADATGRVSVEEAKLADLRQKGAANTRLIAQSEALAKARRAEARATREAQSAYSDLSDSAGESSAQSFFDGFAGASAIGRIAAATGPVGLALAGTAGLGLLAGRKLAQQIELGMASLNMKDTFAARIGVDDATMARYGTAAGKAYASNWGASVQENLGVVQFAIQGGLIDTDATDAEIQRVIEQIQTVATLLGEDSQSISRGVRNFVKTGMVDSTEEALDLLVVASQQGLNISNDLLDTFEEYGTKFRDVGLSGSDALGLINQMWEAGIRNTDVAADALKEFAISAVDGSDSTREAFAALGFNADDMAQRFAEGGNVARDAFGEVLTALNNISDPLQQEIVGTALFKTKWEDAGDAIKNADLGTAATQLGEMEGATQRASDKVGEHASSWGALERQIDQTFSRMREWLADTTIGRFLNQQLPEFLGGFFDEPGIQPIPGVSTQTYPGQVVSPAIPGAGGAIAPPTTGAITGSGTMLENLLGGPTGATAPEGLLAPGMAATGPGPTRITPVPMTPGGGGGGGGAADSTELPRIAVPFGPGYGAGPQPGQTAAQYSAESSLLEAQQKTAQATAEYQQLLDSGTATTDELTQAHNELVKAQRDESEVSLRLAETYAKASGQLDDVSDALSQTSTQLGQIGTQLDADLGISNGLAGVADNITRFIASLAMAPVVGALRGVQAGTGVDPASAGSGLFGIVGSAMGLGGRSAAATPGAAMYSSYMPQMGQQGRVAASGYMGDAALLANVPAGRYTQEARGDLTQGLADCTSAVEDLVNLMDGQPTGGASMSTANAAEWLTSRGFMPGSMPGAFNVGFYDGPGNAGHMQATLPGGTPFNWGSDTSAANRGIGGTGAFDPSLTQRYYRPVGAGPGRMGGGFAPMTPGQLASPGLATPIPRGGGAGTGGLMPGMAGLPQSMGGGAAPSSVGGIAPAGGRGEGGLGVAGGILGMATQALGAAAGAGGMAANVMAPGSGAAISAATDIGVQLLNRGAQFAGQAAGIGVGGLMEAFLPVDSEMADPMNSWFGRIVGGMMGAAPQLPNMAGQAANAPQGQGQGGQAPGADGKPPITVNYTNNQATEDRAGADLTNHLMAMNSGPGQ